MYDVVANYVKWSAGQAFRGGASSAVTTMYAWIPAWRKLTRNGLDVRDVTFDDYPFPLVRDGANLKTPGGFAVFRVEGDDLIALVDVVVFVSGRPR